MPEYPQIETAAKLDLVIQQGSNFVKSFDFGTFDISEYLFRGMVRRTFRSRNSLCSFTFDRVSNSEVDFYLSSEDTSELPATSLVYDIELYVQENNQDVYVARILQGKIKVSSEVTK